MPAPGSAPYFRYEPISSQRRQLDLLLEKSDASARVRTLLQVLTNQQSVAKQRQLDPLLEKIDASARVRTLLQVLTKIRIGSGSATLVFSILFRTLSVSVTGTRLT